MTNNNTRNSTQKPPKHFLHYLLPITLSAVFILFVEFVFRLSGDLGTGVNEPLHSAIEACGGLAAVFMCAMLLHKKEREEFFLVYAGFLGMGLFDGLHSISPPGQSFVFLHSVSVLIGGIGFGLVWFPRLSKAASKNIWLIWGTGGIATLIGIWALTAPETLPEMIRDNHFTVTAISFNLIGGVLFLVAALRFLMNFHRTKNVENMVLASLAILFGFSGIVFPHSTPWDQSWWEWHYYRLFAYFLALGFLFWRAHLTQEKLNQSLRQLETDLVKRKQIEAELAESNTLFKAIIDQAPIPMAISKPNGELLFNPACAEQLQFPYKEGINLFKMKQTWKNYDTEGNLLAPEKLPLLQALQGHTIRDEEYRVVRIDGSERWRVINAAPIYDSNNQLIAGFAAFRDTTDLKSAEKALLRSQKMDAIGQMAGGIAHDFNNILGIILGNLNLMSRHIPQQEKTLKRIAVIKKSTHRAADLTKQLLGFARKQPSHEIDTNINRVIAEMERLVSRSITPKVEVIQHLSEDLRNTKIDAGEFEDALLNLILNARDAMPSGGQLTIETSNCTLDAFYCSDHPGATLGEYVQLSIADSGIGILPEHQEQIFEPFFTTKPEGKGTGLGLAMVFGFVKRSNGYIAVNSKPEVGTTFQLYLPVSEKKTQHSQAIDLPPDNLPRGNETLLVVEDEKDLLDLAGEFLEALGYRVLTAQNGKQALARIKETPEISLLFSDVVMPGGMSGYELAEQAVAIRPRLKVLLTSGYANKVVSDNHLDPSDTPLIDKPYTQIDLAQKLRALLGNSEDEPKTPIADQDTTATPLQKIPPHFTQWSKRLEIGIPQIDQDHQKLMELLNRCQEAVMNNRCGAVLNSILTELLEYTETHFQREEAVMKACNYPGLTSHCQVHQFLIKQVKSRLTNFEQSKLEAHQLVAFLNSWLVDHIQGMDHAIAPYSAGKEALIEKTLNQLKALT